MCFNYVDELMSSNTDLYVYLLLLMRNCDTPAQGLIGLIGYSYQQVATSFPEAGLQRTLRLSVLGPEKFGDG